MTLSIQQVEYWTLTVLDRMKSGQKLEDSRVELKREWPHNYYETARKIAGHANAAHGEDILWIIGADERQRRIVGADNEELANWLPRVKSQFHELAPTLIYSINVPIDHTTVSALLLETSRAPYLVKNPTYGVQSGIKIEREIPWREGESTRTATRADLLRILVPLSLTPKIEILDGYIYVTDRAVTSTSREPFHWSLELDLYFSPRDEATIVIPYHTCRGFLEIPNYLEKSVLNSVRLLPPRATFEYSDKVSPTVTATMTENEVIITGPGRLQFVGHLSMSRNPNFATSAVAHISAEMVPTSTSNPITIDASFSLTEPGPRDLYRWVVS